MSYKSDFHIHTYFSDGCSKPTDIVKKYKEDEYDEIAITDHDGTDGVREAMIAGEALNIKVIPGIELSTEFFMNNNVLEMHILGYNIDIENDELINKLVSIRRDREERNRKLLEVLNQMDIFLKFEDLIQRPGQTYIGKPNFVRAMERKGYEIENPYALLDTVEKKKISAEEGIKLIHNAGGIPVLAHPMKIRNIGEKGSDEFFANLESLLSQLKKHGLKGLECYHPSATDEHALRLVTLAGKYHLHITEGSDFHG